MSRQQERAESRAAYKFWSRYNKLNEREIREQLKQFDKSSPEFKAWWTGRDNDG